ncbi:MAG: flippase-like domain-containing protein [Kiritimatiellae bacterium]|nr:flippase-like domain-containing protein [Kiritimatiellia bacterium]
MNRKTLLIKAAFSVLFFVILFSTVQKGEFIDTLEHVDWRFVVLAFALSALMIASSCLKWKVVLDQMGYRLPFGYLLRTYMVGYYFSALLPSNVGGDVVRSYYVGRRIDNQAKSAISIFIERFSGVLFLLFLVIAAPLMRPGLYPRPQFVIPALGAVGLLFVVIWMWTIRRPFDLPDRIMRAIFAGLRKILGAGRLLNRIEAFYGKVHFRAERFHGKLIRAVSSLGSDRKALVNVLLLTFWYYGLTWVNVYLAFRAFGVKPDFIAMSAVVPTAMIVAALPVTLLGNLGFTEGVYVFFFMAAGMSEASVLAMGLFLRLKLLVTGTIGYFFYLTYRQGKGDADEIRRIAAAEKGAEQMGGPAVNEIETGT